jgi:hypothetical protein
VIDDDEPPSKKQWTTNTAEARPTASQPKPLAPNPKPPTPKPSQQPPPPQPNQRPTPISALPGCVICEGPTPHPARECPVVMGGADSIAQ